METCRSLLVTGEKLGAVHLSGLLHGRKGLLEESKSHQALNQQGLVLSSSSSEQGQEEEEGGVQAACRANIRWEV